MRLKRITTIAFLVIMAINSTAQILVGNQLPIKVKVASYGATQNALLSLPQGYDTSSEKYPLIIFLHGSGQVGNTTADLTKMLADGLPKVLSNGMKLQAVNPVDGKLYKFIVVSPQHHGWTTPPENIDYMLSELSKSYRIDTNRIYLTGLSAGGQGVIQAVTYSQSLTSRIAAIIPMSPSAPDDITMKRFGYFAMAKTGAWFLTGKSDDAAYINTTYRANDSINKYNPAGSKITWFTGGHCCWPTFYTPDYRENGLNIYEWMLQYKRGGRDTVPPSPEPPTDTVKYIKILHDPAAVMKIIVLDRDGKWTEYEAGAITSGEIKIETK